MTEPTAPTAAPRITRPLRAESGVKRLLVVDDEESVRTPIAKFLRSLGYEVQTADSGTAALDCLGRAQFHVMLCDVRLPGVSGLDILPRAIAADQDLAVLMLTAVNDAPTATDALGLGAMDYLIKPIELPLLQQAIERALSKRIMAMDQRRVEQKIREEVTLRTAELAREQVVTRALSVSIIESLINAMEAKDIYLRDHSHRVAELAAAVALALGLDQPTIERVRLAGRIHDVGKIGTREAVLNKPGPLDEEEIAHVKEHVRIGVEILSPLTHIGDALAFVHDHHERFDGTGYPRQLRGQAISVGGRILAAADAFDALTSVRPYRHPKTPAETIEYLATQVGTHLDPAVFGALRKVVLEREEPVLTMVEGF